MEKPTKGRWSPIREAIQDYAERITKNPTSESIKLKEIIEKKKFKKYLKKN